MNKQLTEYLDRLPYDKKEQLREAIGTGELNWHNVWEDLSPRIKNLVGFITFDCEVKNVRMEFERNVSTGYDIPVIIAEPA